MHRCKLFTLLYCMIQQQAHCTRVVITFTNVPRSLESMTGVEGLSIVKQYGRRLVLALPPTRESLIDSEFEFLNTLGTIQGVENDTSVLISSSDQWNLYGTYGIHIHPPQPFKNTSSATAILAITIAILDSGFDGAVEGFDFVSDPTLAGDSDGRDANATDPGKTQNNGLPRKQSCDMWLMAGSVSVECPVATWHGTKVSSIIAGLPTAGLDGVSPQSPLASIRVLGLCDTGYASDVADAIVWSSGGQINGLGSITTAAGVISMSFVGSGPCPSFLQSAVTQALHMGSVLVAAAGNNADDTR